jgi:hypothetical protein
MRGSAAELVDWSRRHRWTLLALVALSATGAFLMSLTTRHGIGLRDDSFSYFTAAEGLLSGDGYGRITGQGTFTPLTNFPPIYPVLLAFTKAIGLDLAAGARLIAGLSFASTVLLAGLAALAATQSAGPSLLAAGLVLFSPSLLQVFSWAHSEDPYLPLVLGFLLLYSVSRQAPHRRYLVVATMSAGMLAVLTRYVGVVLLLVPALDIVFMLMKRGSSIKAPVLVLAGPALGLAAFLARNKLVSGNLTNRPPPSLHLPLSGTLAEGGETVLGWLGLSPISMFAAPSWIAMISLIGCLLALGMWSLRQWSTGSYLHGDVVSAAPQPILHAIHASGYAAMLAASILFLDRLTPLDDRLLSPILISLLVLLAVGVDRLWRVQRSAARWLVPVGAVALIAWQIMLGTSALKTLSTEGMGFNSPVWRSAHAIDAIAELPDRPIYTNNVPALYFLSRRQASFIPARYDPAGDRLRSDYSSQLADMRRTLAESCGYLIILGWPPESRLTPDHLADLNRGLHLITRTRDGLIYGSCEE